MKRIILAVLILITWNSNLFAAGTCVQATGSPEYIYKKIGNNTSIAGKLVELTCTHHTDNSLSVALTTAVMNELAGWYVKKLKTIPSGVTAPTDATDLEIADSDGLSLLGSNGTDKIDATSTLETLLYNTSLSLNDFGFPVASEPWTISTTNNAVASAIFTLKIYLVP